MEDPLLLQIEVETYTSSNYSNLYLSINAYGNLEFKWLGFGLGFISHFNQ